MCTYMFHQLYSCSLCDCFFLPQAIREKDGENCIGGARALYNLTLHHDSNCLNLPSADGLVESLCRLLWASHPNLRIQAAGALANIVRNKAVLTRVAAVDGVPTALASLLNDHDLEGRQFAVWVCSLESGGGRCI